MTVVERLDALARAVAAGVQVLPAPLVDRARALEERAGQRLRLSTDHTVVAFAGATGSGKSSLVNALAGQSVAEVDVLRPTTSEALAVVRGAEDGSTSASAEPLLDWLGVRRRHHLDGPADDPAAPEPPGGLVLLDLPDHDSVRTEHRLEAERLVALVDLMVWVLDPQKYADAVVHERYLRGLTAHAEVMLVVLNQVDRLSSAERVACHRDLERLLAEDGLAGVPLLDTSARTGEGVDALRAALDDAAQRRVAATARLEADVVHLAREVQEACGPVGSATGPTRAERTELVDALAASAGVPVVADAVHAAYLLHAHQATGWPPTRWLSRFRADPLRRLHLPGPAARAAGRGRRRAAAPTPEPRAASELVRTSVPPPGPAQTARARAAVRTYTDAATSGAPDAWVLAARHRTEDPERRAALPDALDRAVGGARVVDDRRPVWWAVAGGLQWLLLSVLVVGAGWLGVLAALDALRLPVAEPPRWGQVLVPTAAALGGAVLGLLLAGVCRLLARVGANRRARRATADLRVAVGHVADRLVVAPVEDVVAAWRTCRAAADTAAEPPSTAATPNRQRGRR